MSDVEFRVLDEYPDYKIYFDGSIYSDLSHKILKPTKKRNGYYYVCLTTETGKIKTMMIHRLVALVFIPNPNQYPQINHIDCNKLNNNVSNLEWCSHTQNLQDASRHKLLPGNKTNHGKLNVEQIIKIRSSNLSIRKLALIYNVSRREISYIKANQKWRNL
jgi:hypothetical protein